MVTVVRGNGDRGRTTVRDADRGRTTVRDADRGRTTVRDADRGRTTVRDAACPLSEIARAIPDEPVAGASPRLNACSQSRALVFADGHLVGILSPADMSRAPERLSRNPGPFESLRR